MGEQIHVLAQHLLGKPSVAACDLQDLKNLVQRYPYFAPAQFLLLEKLRQEGSPDYTAQLQKAVLYYHNPLAFEYFISAPSLFAEADLETEIAAPAQRETGFAQQEDVPMNSDEIQSPTATEEVAEPVLEEPLQETETPPQVEAAAPVDEFAPVLPEAEQAAAPTDEKQKYGPDERTEWNEPELHAWEGSVKGTETETEAKQTDHQEEPEINMAGSFAGLPSRAEMNHPDNFAQPAANEPLAFEPFHTVDYFASQGIKLSQEEVSTDKFGKQLKSFTEWLKTMKRLPAPEQAPAVDASTEKNVVHLAEDSVHDPGIVTEAMAEVWTKQGNKAKALEVYHKLSLLNPSKNAYFAAKIENLKRL